MEEKGTNCNSPAKLLSTCYIPRQRQHFLWPAPHIFVLVFPSYLYCCLMISGLGNCGGIYYRGYIGNYKQNGTSVMVLPFFFFFLQRYE